MISLRQRKRAKAKQLVRLRRLIRRRLGQHVHDAWIRALGSPYHYTTEGMLFTLARWAAQHGITSQDRRAAHVYVRDYERQYAREG